MTLRYLGDEAPGLERGVLAIVVLEHGLPPLAAVDRVADRLRVGLGDWNSARIALDLDDAVVCHSVDGGKIGVGGLVRLAPSVDALVDEEGELVVVDGRLGDLGVGEADVTVMCR